MKVRRQVTGKVTSMEPEAEALFVQSSPNNDLRFGVLAFDRAHGAAAELLVFHYERRMAVGSEFRTMTPLRSILVVLTVSDP